MSEPLLRVTDLRKEFGDRNAVAGISFDVAAGGSLAIVGESGSGKTTVARMLVGLERPTGGEIRFEGIDQSHPARSRRERLRRAHGMQLVFQDPYTSLDRRQSVAECLDEALRLYLSGAEPDRRQRLDELADMVGFDERQLRALPRALSGGQRQRVAIARVLAAAPRLIILDEAVAALDVSIQAQVLNLLADIREQTGVAYILISHDLAVVRQLTEHVVVMRDGVIIERGPTAAVLDDPREPYTKLLRDCVPRPGWRPRRRSS
ncbi:MAG TPA: ATP-binding cassette domain-containing protein [Ilumatobacteraceae bacterium]